MCSSRADDRPPPTARDGVHRPTPPMTSRIAPIGLALLAPLAAFLSCQALAPPAPLGPRFAGAGATRPVSGGVLRIHHESDLRSLDPATGFDEISGVAVRLLFDPLITYDQDGGLVPALLRELPEASEDGRRFILRLRGDRRFHDGSRIDAEDVRFSLERVRDPAINSPYASYLEGVSQIRVLDPRTVEIRLHRPDHAFPFVLAMDFARPVPREHYGDGDARRFAPVGSGPYRLHVYERDLRVVLERWNGHPKPAYPDRLVYELNLQREPAFLRFRGGEIEHTHRQSKADYLLLKQAKAWGPTHQVYPTGELWGLEMNCEIPPFDDVHVRRAVAFAIDRERWARARRHLIAPLGQPLPRNMPGHDADLPHRQTFDLERARQELAAAGHPEGLPEPVDLWVGQGDVAKAYAELAQADLAAIGIDVRVKQVAFSVYLDQTRRRGAVAFFLGGWTQDYPHPSTFLDALFHSRAIADVGAINKAFYANPDVDRLLDEARQERDPQAQRVLYRRAASLVARDAPWAFVFENRRSEAWQPYLRGYRPHPIHLMSFRDAWLDLPRHRTDGLADPVSGLGGAVGGRPWWAAARPRPGPVPDFLIGSRR